MKGFSAAQVSGVRVGGQQASTFPSQTAVMPAQETSTGLDINALMNLMMTVMIMVMMMKMMTGVTEKM